MKPLFLIVGTSGTGKTTLADMLEDYCKLIQVRSYTTRPPRYKDEKSHTFIDEDAFNKLNDMVAFTRYNNYLYCATAEQLDRSSVYVVDVPGVTTLLEYYRSDRKIVIFYLSASVHTKITRMKARGDGDSKILDRIYNDHQSNWLEELEKVVGNDKRARIIFIDANQNKDDVFKEVLSYVSVYNE